MKKKEVPLSPNPSAQSVEARAFAQQMGINPDQPIYDPLGAANQIVLNLLRDSKRIRYSPKQAPNQEASQPAYLSGGKGCGACGS